MDPSESISQFLFMFYVDGMLLISDSEEFIADKKNSPVDSSKFRYIGVLKHFLGVKTGQKRSGTFYLSKDQFVSKLLTEYSMKN